MRYLLDTNIISDLVQNSEGVAMQRLQQVGDDVVCTSIIVSAEIWFGLRKRRSQRLAERVEGLLDRLVIIPFDKPADVIYGQLRAQLEEQGRPISGNDLLIAAQAIAFDLTLVTDNEREFLRIDDLAVENWLR